MVFNVNVVTSKHPLDCGATCLKMLLSYYNIEADLDVLRRQLNTRLIGCTVKDLIDVGKIYGLDLKAYGNTKESMPVDDIFKQNRPAIIHWLYSHFCIYCGIDEDGKVVVINPDRGRLKVSKGTFRSFFSCTSVWNGVPHDI